MSKALSEQSSPWFNTVMYLRNILILFSLVFLGFTLSLYFQTDQNVDTLNWDQYKSLTYDDDRSHSLQDVNKKIAPLSLEGIIQEIWERNRLSGEKTRVMEIGAGNGLALMALKNQFPDIEFYAINRKKTHTFYRRESFILTALKFDLMTRPELKDIDLPYVIFQDLDFSRPIPYGAEKFDLIYSYDRLRHVKYKFELLNEVMRVLKPGALSLHTDVTGINVYARGVILDKKEAFYEMRKRSIDINTLDNPLSIRIKKGPVYRPFPVTPHHPLPENLENIPEELRRPVMGYNLIYQ